MAYKMAAAAEAKQTKRKSKRGGGANGRQTSAYACLRLCVCAAFNPLPARACSGSGLVWTVQRIKIPHTPRTRLSWPCREVEESAKATASRRRKLPDAVVG